MPISIEFVSFARKLSSVLSVYLGSLLALGLIQRSFAVCLLLVSAWILPVAAQYRLDHWTAQNGLPQNSVRDVLQTRDGYLWFTTYDGLVRFDGVRFTVFNKSNSPGLSSNRFTSLAEDENGDLWAVVETGQIVRRHKGRFTTYNQDDGLPISQSTLPWLATDENGKLSLFTQNVTYRGTLVRKLTYSFYRFQNGSFQFSESREFDIAGDPRLIEAVNTAVTSYIVKDEIWNSTAVGFMVLRNDGSIQIIGADRGGVSTNRPSLISGKGKPIRQVSKDHSGKLWITVLATGERELLAADVPSDLEILRGWADNEGNIWFATLKSGLIRAKRQSFISFAADQGLDNEQYTIFESRDGSIWTSGNSLFRVKDGRLSRYPPFVPHLMHPTAIFEDHDDQVWINGGWRPENGRLVQAPWADTLVRNAFFLNTAAFADAHGALWFGSDKGVLRYENGISTVYTTREGLATNDIKVIVGDGNGGLWIGGYGGLTHYKDGMFTTWSEESGLPGSTIRALKVDEDGTLWIGTYDSGLARFKDGRFTKYSTKEGLFDNGVFQILEDNFGWFWMSCNRGIFRVRKSDLIDIAEGETTSLASTAYNESDGLPSSEANGGRWPAGVRSRDGKLWFPTMSGIAVIDPATVSSSTQPPPVMLEEMRINNEPVDADAWDSAVESTEAAVRILPGQDNFEIAYTALSFINSENMRFRYKLDGADHDWVDAGTRRTAYYSHVTPGDYTFTVIAANSDGVWNTTGASLRISIIPPFWRTWWFATLGAFLVFAALVAIYRSRVSRLLRMQTAQQAFARQLISSQEAERKRIASELHDSIGQSLVVIRSWALMGANQLADGSPAKEELEEINSIASRSVSEVREIAYDLGPFHLERLGFENALRDMVTRVSRSSEIEIESELDPIDNALSREEEMSLYRIAQEALNNVVKHSGATRAKVTLKYERNAVRMTVTDNGVGFDRDSGSARDATYASQEHGLGLNGMSERVRLLGGTFAIQSSIGNGTRIDVSLAASSMSKNGEYA